MLPGVVSTADGFKSTVDGFVRTVVSRVLMETHMGSAGPGLVFGPSGEGHGAHCRCDRARWVQRDDGFPGLPRLRVFDGALPRRQSRADRAQERSEMGKVCSAHDRKAAKACHEINRFICFRNQIFEKKAV